MINGTDGLVSTGTLGIGVLAPTGTGTKMFWNPKKAAFRAGGAFATSWDDTNVGDYSTAFGLGTSAIGDYSGAFGFFTTARGNYSSVFGQNNIAASYGESVFGIGATNYIPSLNGAIQNKIANATDRLFVVGNAIDANNNNLLDAVERSNALVILKNGNIGIGSSTPQSKIQIIDENVIPTGTGTIHGNLSLMSNSPQGADIGAAISMGGFSDNASLFPRIFGTIEARKLGNSDLGQNGYLSFKTNIGGGLVEAMRLLNRRVGIGTAVPLEALHVVGSIRMIDGNEGAGKALISDGAGTGIWQNVAVSNGWGLLGNSIVLPTNFIGTTDPADDFRFRSRGSWAGMLGLNNTSFGRFSLSSTVGTLNTAFGYASLSSNTSGSENSSLGYNSLSNNTTGDRNTAVGNGSLSANTTGDKNISIGYNSLQNNTNGGENIAIGIDSMKFVEEGDGNIAIGKLALTRGSNLPSALVNNNIAIGNNALPCGACFENIAIGNFAGNNAFGGTNNVFIGSGAGAFLPLGVSEVILGNGSTIFAGIQVAWTTTSDRRYKNTIQKTNLGLDFIKKLNPVCYLRNNDERKKTEYGFIAQELEEALNSFGASDNGMIAKNKEGMYGVRYNDLFAPIVKSVQELAQENEELSLKLDEQQKINQSILERLALLEKK